MPNALEALVEFDGALSLKGEWVAVQILMASDGSVIFWFAGEAFRRLNMDMALDHLATLCREQAQLHRPSGRA